MTLRTRLLAASAGFVLAAVAAAGAQTEAPITQRPGRNLGYQETVKPLPEPVRHLLYIAEPSLNGNGMLPPGTGGAGLIVLDADHDYRFVKRISFDVAASLMPGPEVSGITASTVTNMVYVAAHGYLNAYNLATDKLVWSFKGEPKPVKPHFIIGDETGCCERPWTLPDGKTLLVGSSYNSWWYLIDAKSGKLEGKIQVPDSPLSHNLAVTPDGKTAFLSSLTDTVSIADVATRKVTKTIKFTYAVRPITINHDGSRVYVNTDDNLGFEIGDPKTGKMIKKVEAPAEMWKDKWRDPMSRFFGHGGPGHGLGMTPDEKEIWAVDNINNGLLVFDNQGDDNWVYNPVKSFKTTYSAGWITMTNDGRTAFLGSDIVDVRSHKIIGQMKDETGSPLGSEKLLLMAFRNGHLIETDNQFAVGLPAAVEAAAKQAAR